MTSIIPVILSGGSGTRLWPASRECYPKQFLSLVGNRSLLQDSLLRMRGREGFEHPVVIGSDEHRFLIAAQAQEADSVLQSLILEPVPRDTAPAIASVAHWAARQDPSVLLFIMPADHFVEDPAPLFNAINRAIDIAKSGWLVSFGIPPRSAHTGYGYVKRSETLIADEVWKAEHFTEKPDRPSADMFVSSGDYYWNSGMYMFRADSLLSELSKYSPSIVRDTEQSITNGVNDLDFFRLDKDCFSLCQSISIDYALMQSTQRLAIAPAPDLKWSDIGSWDAVYLASPADALDNVTSGNALLDDCSGNLIQMHDGRVVVGLGLTDLVIISTPDALLVTKRDRSPEIKPVVERLRRAHPDCVISNQRMYRPWGHYEILHLGDRHQVKHILVKPGGRLSMQKHYHRSEHWIVVRGTARIHRNDDVNELTENQSLYIPLGAIHSLENPGRIPLSLIEVQTGSYLGEDDIERFNDFYGRV